MQKITGIQTTYSPRRYIKQAFVRTVEENIGISYMSAVLDFAEPNRVGWVCLPQNNREKGYFFISNTEVK